MDKLLYDLMDWAGIEELVYSESPDPHRILGAHLTENGMLVQAFIPTARNIPERERRIPWRWQTRRAFLRL